MLTDLAIRNLKPRDNAYKAADRDGMYVVVSPTGNKTFRFDYRFNGRRETLTIGRYPEVSLTQAREELIKARRQIRDGISPARTKADGKEARRDTVMFAGYAALWLENGGLAESTKAMRKTILDRDILPVFGKRLLEEIRPSELMALCDRIKARGAPATAVHTREIVGQVYRHAIGRGLQVENPADKIQASKIAVFKPRDRALSPAEIRTFFTALESVATLPTLKLALRLILLTLVRKGELIGGQWPEVDFEQATWTIPGARMKAGRPHVVYLSNQALDILVALKTCAGGSPYLLPGRYDTEGPISNATLNRVIDVALAKLSAEGREIEPFSVHDLRRTGSTLLHESGFNSDWIEKCLAHEQKGVRAVYNKAEYAEQRRQMLQTWADMVDGWIRGGDVVPLRRVA
jgi:integrase